MRRILIACVALLAVACAREEPAPRPDQAAASGGAAGSDTGRAYLAEGGVSTVVVEQIQRLSFAGLPRAPNALSHVFRLPSGGWGVASEVFDNMVQLFDSLGAPAGTLGRSGSGPGEFRGAIRGVAAGGSLYITDTRNARLSRFDRELAFVDSRPLSQGVVSLGPTGNPSTVLVSGLLAGRSAGVDRAGDYRSVGLYGMDGADDIVGGEVPEYVGGDPKSELQFAAMTETDEVWTVARIGGAVDVLTNSLAVAERYRLPVDRYVDLSAWATPPDGPPPPEVTGITSDGQGVLWVLIGVPDQDWSPDLDDDVDGIDAMFDTLLIAIDAEGRTIIGTRTIDPVCFPVHLGALSCVDDSAEVIQVMRVRLAGVSS